MCTGGHTVYIQDCASDAQSHARRGANPTPAVSLLAELHTPVAAVALKVRYLAVASRAIEWAQAGRLVADIVRVAAVPGLRELVGERAAVSFISGASPSCSLADSLRLSQMTSRLVLQANLHGVGCLDIGAIPGRPYCRNQGDSLHMPEGHQECSLGELTYSAESIHSLAKTTLYQLSDEAPSWGSR